MNENLTCKDCIHYEVCGYHITEETNFTVNECPKHFLNKANYVERKVANWIEDGYTNSPCVCSNCGAEANYITTFIETFDYDWEESLQPTGCEEIREYVKTPYCSYCGAEMN